MLTIAANKSSPKVAEVRESARVLFVLRAGHSWLIISYTSGDRLNTVVTLTSPSVIGERRLDDWHSFTILYSLDVPEVFKKSQQISHGRFK
jgi:hypothetical protein